jgi:hypothetical protein
VFEVIRPLNNIDESLTDVDVKYLRCLWNEVNFDGAGKPIKFTQSICLKSLNDSIDDSFLVSNIPRFSFGSKAYRYSYPAFASAYSCKEETVSDTWEYLAKGYKYIREAIAGRLYLEIITATYLLFLQEYVGQEHFEPSLQRMLVYFQGLWEAFGNHRLQILQSTTVCSCQAYNVCFGACLCIIRLLTCVWLSEECHNLGLIEQMGNALQSALNAGFYNPTWNKTNNELCLDYFLCTVKKELPAAYRARKMLLRSLRETISWAEINPITQHLEAASNRICPWSEDFQPSRLSSQQEALFDYHATCIQMARLLSSLAEVPTSETTNQATWNALILCNVLSSGAPGMVCHTYQAIHILFWVGLVLRKPVYSRGTSL